MARFTSASTFWNCASVTACRSSAMTGSIAASPFSSLVERELHAGAVELRVEVEGRLKLRLGLGVLVAALVGEAGVVDRLGEVALICDFCVLAASRKAYAICVQVASVQSLALSCATIA